jgi:hypothetical protein
MLAKPKTLSQNLACYFSGMAMLLKKFEAYFYLTHLKVFIYEMISRIGKEMKKPLGLKS